MTLPPPEAHAYPSANPTVITFDLVLASSSPYRQAQLKTLGLPFRCVSPDIDETPFDFEPAQTLAKRLALTKAQTVALQNPQSIVIGADQVLDLDGTVMGKPGSMPAAFKQLERLSGRKAVFYSAISLITNNTQQVACEPTSATFRRLSPRQIHAYLRYDKPFDTAGSAKAESLGIALLEKLSSDDPSAIIGLPLITLTGLLCQAGLDPLMYHQTI